MAAVGADNASVDSNNIISAIKDTKLYISVVTLSAKDNQKVFIGTNIKQKVRIKIRQMNIDIFSNQIFIMQGLIGSGNSLK